LDRLDTSDDGPDNIKSEGESSGEQFKAKMPQVFSDKNFYTLENWSVYMAEVIFWLKLF